MRLAGLRLALVLIDYFWLKGRCDRNEYSVVSGRAGVDGVGRASGVRSTSAQQSQRGSVKRYLSGEALAKATVERASVL